MDRAHTVKAGLRCLRPVNEVQIDISYVESLQRRLKGLPNLAMRGVTTFK